MEKDIDKTFERLEKNLDKFDRSLDRINQTIDKHCDELIRLVNLLDDTICTEDEGEY